MDKKNQDWKIEKSKRLAKKDLYIKYEQIRKVYFYPGIFQVYWQILSFE